MILLPRSETLVSEPQAALLGPETVCFFAVPDDALPELVRAWQQVLPAEVAAVAHGSGALGLELLAGFPAAMQLAIHPMRALPPRGTEAALQGAPLTLLASTATANTATSASATLPSGTGRSLKQPFLISG